jgi:chemotaxis protein MotA
MHVVLGALTVVGTFLLAMQYKTMEFNGFINLYAGILLGGVPLGLMMVTYQFNTLGKALRGLWKTLTGDPEAERERLADNLLEFGRQVRRDRAAAASEVLERESNPVFKRLGRHVLEGTSPDEIETDAVILTRKSMEDTKRARKVLSSLGDFAPAMGMIGTLIGLIQLLSEMTNFQNLGPGMAIALLTTFYGLLLAHLVYLPLARLVADHGSQRTENMNLVIEGMLKLARYRPLTEIRDVIRANGDEQTSRAANERAAE